MFKMSDDNQEMMEAPFIEDGRFTRKYAKQLVEYANQITRPDERKVYFAIINALIEENDLDKPQDFIQVDMLAFDILRSKRIQKILMEKGEVQVSTSKSGRVYMNSQKAGYLLNAIENQIRKNMKDLGLTRKERLKRELGVDKKDFSSFMSEPVEVDAIVEDGDELVGNGDGSDKSSDEIVDEGNDIE